MTVESIMSVSLVTLKPTDTVRYALQLMREQFVQNLPVVKDDGTFVGLFGVRQVVHLLLPKAAQIEYGLEDLSFMPDELGEFYHRLQEVGEQPVSDYLEPGEDLLFCNPTTSLPEVLELLHLSFFRSLPVIVVEEDGNRLLGMVSAWDVMEKLVTNVFPNNAR